MQSKVIAILETRTGAHLGQLITSRGGVPLLAPALAEEPDLDIGELQSLLALWRTRPMKLVIFQTGVGTRALFQATDGLGLTNELLELLAASTVVVRGPKPVGELNARRVRIAHRASSPFTTADVLDSIAPIPIACEHVLIQQYGAPNRMLRAALEQRGATVHEIATYRWALPVDRQPLLNLLEALAQKRVDAVVFERSAGSQSVFGRGAFARGPACRADRTLHRCLDRPRLFTRARAIWGRSDVRSEPAEIGPAAGRARGRPRATEARLMHQRAVPVVASNGLAPVSADDTDGIACRTLPAFPCLSNGSAAVCA